MKKFLALAILLTLFLPADLFAISVGGKEYESLFYFFDNVYGLKNFKKNHTDVDVIAPQIYTVGYDLKVSKPSNTKIISEAKKKKINTVPLIVNKDFSKVLMSDILLNQDAQDEIIDFMIDEAKKNKFAGWQFDFENINHLDREMYSKFVEKTYAKMKENDLQFSVAVIVRDDEYNPDDKNQDWSAAYDYKKIGENSDFVSLMSYDDPESVGPVSSLPYLKNVLNYVTTKISPEKLSMGVPLYCWKWSADDNVRLGSTTYKLAEKAYKKGQNKKKGYDKKLGAEYFSYDEKGVSYKIWCDNSTSLKTKLSMIDERGMRGFSAWALGQEDPDIWKILR